MGKEVTYCKYVTLEELTNAFQDTDKHGRVKAISKHKINNAFDLDYVPLSDNVSGIHGMVPPKGLHTFRSCIYETLIDTVHDVVGVGNKNSSDKDKVNDLHLLVVDGMKRHSEQDMPQPMVRNGIMDGTQMGGQNYVQMCLHLSLH